MHHQRRQTAMLTAILLTLSITTAISLRPAPLPAAPPTAKPIKKDAKKKAAIKALAEFRRGVVLYRQKKYADAVTQFAIAARDYDTAGEAILAAYALVLKGHCHRDAKDDRTAVKTYAESVQRFAQLKEKGLKGLVIPAFDLGKALQRLRRYKEAAKAFGLAAAAYRQLKQPIKANKATDSRLAAKHAQLLSRLSPADRKLLDQATALNKQLVSLYKKGRYQEAAQLGRKAVDLRKKVLGQNHPHYALSLNNLAALYRVMRDYVKAEPLYRQALEIRKKVLGENHPATATSLKGLAVTADDQGKALQRLRRYQDAARAFGQAAAAYRQLKQPIKANKATDSRLAAEHAQLLSRLSPADRKLLDQAAALNTQLVSLKRKGGYREAAQLGRKVVGIHKRVLGENNPITATSLNNLAFLHQAMAEYVKAEPLYQQALAIRKKVLGEQHPRYALSLNNLATLYRSMGDYAKAKPFYRQALAINKKVLGENHPGYAVSLNNLAALYRSMGDSRKAEPLYRQALAIRKKVLGENHPDYAASLNNLAMLYWSMSDYATAEPFYRRASGIWKKVLGEQHPRYATSLNNLAELYKSMGNYAKAEPLLWQALAIRKKVLGENHPDYATSLSNLALLYQSMGDYAKAEPLYRQALAIKKKVLGENHSDYALSLSNLAFLYQAMGDYAKAEPLFRHALMIHRKVLGENHPHTATILNNLATLYQSMRNYAKAEPIQRQALAIKKKTLGENHPSYADSLNNLAELYRVMGDYAKAKPLIRQALAIKKKVLGENHPDYAISLSNLALLYQSMGDYVKAEPLFRQTLAISRGILERTSTVQSERQQLAMGQMLRHRLDVYISLAVRKKDIPRRAFEQVLLWKGATLVRQRRYRQVANEPAVADLFKKLQSTTMRLSSLARAFPAKQNAITGWKKRIAALTAEKEQLEVELSKKSATFRQAKREITLADLCVALPKDTVLVDFLEYHKFDYVKLPPKKGKPVQNRSKMRSTRSLVAFVVRPDKKVTLVDLGPSATIASAIDTWRKTFGLSPQGMAAGRLLRKRVWEPLLPAIGKAKTVLVSPDGVLGRLPLGALPGKKPGTYLLEDHRLAIIPVPQLLPALVNEQGRKQVAKGLLLMGDVDYSASPQKPGKAPPKKRKSWRRSAALVRGTATFGPLPATAGEIAFVKDLFREVFEAGKDDVTALKKTAATESQFRKLAPQFYHIHLATHGFFAPPQKMSALSGTAIAKATQSQRGGVYDRGATAVSGFSPGLLTGIVFAGANRNPQADRDDGILTAEEIAFLPLDGVQLVTLSACQTGLGKSAGGEGLLGVQRAFQISGARTTVSSYWKVDDLATRRLMERFYRNLWEKKMTRLDALRESQLWLLKNPEQLRGLIRLDKKRKQQRTPPYYWAAFQLSGDWRR